MPHCGQAPNCVGKQQDLAGDPVCECNCTRCFPYFARAIFKSLQGAHPGREPAAVAAPPPAVVQQQPPKADPEPEKK